MFFSITFLVIIFHLVSNADLEGVRLKSLLVFLFFFFCCYFISILSLLGFFEALSNDYFSVFSQDSLRYLREVRLFSENILHVNEISGVYVGYEATPKFGLSVMLAFVAAFIPIESDAAIYILSNMMLCLFVFGVYVLYVRLCEKLELPRSCCQFFFVLFFVFPFDWYWVTRFLREGLVNVFFLGSLLSFLCSIFVKKTYFSWLLIFTCLMVLFRAQLALLSISMIVVVAACLNRRSGVRLSYRFYFLMGLCGVMALEQTFKASGMIQLREINVIFEEGGLSNAVGNISISQFAYVFMLAASLFPASFIKETGGEVAFNWFYFFMGASFIVVVATAIDSQIRFMYPVFIALKFFVFVFVLGFVFRRRAGYVVNGFGSRNFY